ncbi:MAG: SCO family protein [Kofleriaceae bacterium]
MLDRLHIALVVLLAAQPALAGDSPRDVILPPPPTYKANEVTVSEKLGAQLPLDAKFRNQDGAIVTLGEVIGASELPTILTFNYSDCPMLCSYQLNGLTAVLPTIAAPAPASATDRRNVVFRLGEQVRIVTIDLEPHESLEKLGKMRDKYLARAVPDEAARKPASKGWTYLVAATPGDGAEIRRVADAVGFSYAYVKERAEWAHPAALIFLSARGVVTRYVYGIEFAPEIMRESILKAGIAEPATAVGFMNRCYHFDPNANSHTEAGVFALRLAAGASVFALVIGLCVAHLIRRHRRGLLPVRGES